MTESKPWYQQYLDKAGYLGINIANIKITDKLKRQEMAFLLASTLYLKKNEPLKNFYGHTKYLTLNYSSNKLRVIIKFNDYVIESNKDKAEIFSTFLTRPLDEFTKSGKNKLTIEIIEALPVKEGEEKPSLHLDLSIQNEGNYVDSNSSGQTDGALLTYNWKPGENFITKELSLPDTYTIPIWDNAPSITLDQTNKEEIKSAIKQIYDAFKNNDLESLKTLMKVKNQELARIDQTDPEIEEQDYFNFFNEQIVKAGYKLEPFDFEAPNALIYTPQWNGKLIEVTGKDDTDPITFSATGDSFSNSYFLIMAKINGKWIWVK